MRSWQITTESYIIEGNDEVEAIEKWFQFLQFTGFFVQEYKGAEPIGDKGNRRLVICTNKNGGQIIISVKDQSKADRIQENERLRQNVETQIKILSPHDVAEGLKLKVLEKVLSDAKKTVEADGFKKGEEV